MRAFPASNPSLARTEVSMILTTIFEICRGEIRLHSRYLPIIHMMASRIGLAILPDA
jgi:hypothetical protein